jgi:hypothetical protein
MGQAQKIPRTYGNQGTDPLSLYWGPLLIHICPRWRRHVLRSWTTLAALSAALHRRERDYLMSTNSHHRFSPLPSQLWSQLTLPASVSGVCGQLRSVLHGTRSRAWQPRAEEDVVSSCCPRVRRASLVERPGPCDETIQVKEILIEKSNMLLLNIPVTGVRRHPRPQTYWRDVS